MNYLKLSDQIQNFIKKNWSNISQYRKDHLAIRVLRTSHNNTFFMEYMADFDNRTHLENKIIRKAIKEGGNKYTQNLTKKGRYKHVSKKKRLFLEQNPLYLPINNYIWTIYSRYQTNLEIQNYHVDYAERDYIKKLYPQLIDIYASRILNNIFCLNDVLHYDFKRLKLKSCNLLVQKINEFPWTKKNFVNNFYFLTHILINKSLFYTKYIPSNYLEINWGLTLNLIFKQINSSDLAKITKIDMIAEIIICLHLLKIKIKKQYFKQLNELINEINTDLFITKNAHTYSILLLINYIYYNLNSDEKIPFYKIKI